MAKSSVNVLDEAHGETWAAYQADCVDFASQMPSNSIDFSIYSPPFSNLYVYSDSICDMGNSVDDGEFFRQYSFLIREKYRITKPGRLSAVHCIDLPNFKWKDGHTSLRDFQGEIIREHLAHGWRFHSRITIWKDPVVEMQRTKAIGLLYKQIKKDSTVSRMGLADYMLVFRKDGDGEHPVSHTAAKFPVEQWQKWASPVWMDIRQSNVLNGKDARQDKDEKHICPLQLDVIERCLHLWTNEGDTVFSPFMGIGSEGYQSVKFRRRFIGTELKASYFAQAVDFLRRIEAESASLFDRSHADRQQLAEVVS